MRHHFGRERRGENGGLEAYTRVLRSLFAGQFGRGGARQEGVLRIESIIGGVWQREDVAEQQLITANCGVPRCCGAFTPSTRVVSRRGGRGWSLYRF